MEIERLTLKELCGQITWKQLWTLMTVAAGIISGSYFLGVHFTRVRSEIELAQKEQEIQGLKTQWAYIEPQITLGRYFDLKKQVVSVNSREMPKRSVLIDQQFLARTDMPDLRYYMTSELKYKEELGDTPPGSCLRSFSNLAPIYIWRGARTYKVKIADRRTTLTLFPHIGVQKVFKTTLEKKMQELFRCYRTAKESELKLDNNLAMRLEAFAANLDRVDIAGLLYALAQFNGYLATVLNPDFNWKSNVVQKEEGFVYGNSLNALKNVQILADGKQLATDVIYLRNQTILVETTQSIYSITINVPSPTITVDVGFAEVANRWLSDLRLLYD